MRRPQPESVLSLAALGPSGDEEVEVEEVEVEEVALAVVVEAIAAAAALLRSMILDSIAAAEVAREGNATAERTGPRAWAAAAAAARGAGKDMAPIEIFFPFSSDVFPSTSRSLAPASELSLVLLFDVGGRKKAKERRTLFSRQHHGHL